MGHRPLRDCCRGFNRRDWRRFRHIALSSRLGKHRVRHSVEFQPHDLCRLGVNHTCGCLSSFRKQQNTPVVGHVYPPTSTFQTCVHYTSIPRSAAMRSSTGGCVENSFDTQAPAGCAPKGFEIKRCAVAVEARAIGERYELIFCRAEAKPSGYLVRSAPEASARNSRLRETASWMSCAASGAKIIEATNAIRISGLLLRLRSPPPKWLMCIAVLASTEIMPTSTTTTVITRISLLPTCASSCAMTPSSSLLSITASSPVVTVMTACSLSRPVANALGCESSII